MKRMISVFAVCGAILSGCLSSGCGYHVGGQADLMPKSIHTIYIEPFHNGAQRTDINRLLMADLAREFLSRTRYKMANDPRDADAVLAGAVTNLATGATTADPTTGRSTGALLILQMNVYLTERATGKSLFRHDGYDFRERYEISENPSTYFDESSTAVQRVTRDAARTIVTGILENF